MHGAACVYCFIVVMKFHIVFAVVIHLSNFPKLIQLEALIRYRPVFTGKIALTILLSSEVKILLRRAFQLLFSVLPCFTLFFFNAFWFSVP